MKKFSVFILIVLFSLAAFAQKPRPASSPANSATKNIGGEKEELDKAIALADSAERIAALKKFIGQFPKSKEKNRASELIVSARAALADEKMRAGEREKGIALFKLAVGEAPKPVSDKLFTDVILQIPSNLFFRGERDAAAEIARLAEEKADGNAKQMLALATFYLGTENASEVKRLADKALALDANLPAAYQTLGIANRLNFGLEDAAAAYQKALELDPNSAVSKRSLAEMKRATGKPAEAVALYREVLAANAADAVARTGLVLALFDAEKRDEAEAEMQKFLDEIPNNLFLLVGAAYWYAAHNDGAKAVETAEKAVAIEPRYTWARIALARGLMMQKRTAEAEKALLVASQYGNFPTLDYEIAAARLQAGFYREAAEGLRKTFTIKDNSIETKLGGRVSKNAKDFIELLDLERRASIFEPLAADSAENAERLKSLLDFYQKLDASNDDATISAAADEFIKGDDKAKLHRQLFVANQLLEKKKNLPKVLELTRAAVAGVDAGLDVPNPAAAVLADELYDNRKLAVARGELIIVPEVSRPTLLNILRGRIEDAAGWALFQQNKPADAVVRLKRAVSVLPEKSSLWRNSMWRLGTALEADGKSKDALDAYIKSYTNGETNAVKYGIVESLYQKVNGNTDGLEAKIGAKPASIVADLPAPTEQTTVQKTEIENPRPEPTPEVKAVEKSLPPVEIKPEEKPSPTTEIKPAPEVSASPETKTESPVEIKKVEDQPTETKIETKEAEKKPAPEAAPKPLFDTVVIIVPKIEPAKKSPTENKENESPKDKIETSKTTAEKKSSGEEIQRPRVVIEDNLGQAAACVITTNQNAVSIFSNRGSLGVLVGFEGAGDVNAIKATSSSPNDVAVTSEPEIGALSNRAYFVIKSISRKTGEFTVTFEAACGRKVITVKVR